jgi:aspartyl-tRNA synthetase
MPLNGLLRSHHCGQLRKENVGQEVALCGWVNKSRDLGGLHFKDVRDKYGMTQLNFSNYSQDAHVSLESTIRVHGKVQARPSDAKNKDMDTGEVEVLVEKFEILSSADKDKLPFLPMGKIEATEDLRLKYRYLDLRGKRLQNILKIRSEAAQKARKFLGSLDFVEVETPILYKSTPEGARDYLVPSRVHPNKVYALPQSPQTLKQLLMIGGTDRYFQIVKCFRDEDLRADRQPEFSQIDIELSFATRETLIDLCEKMIIDQFSLSSDFKLKQLKHSDVMKDYGSDKPDLRFGLKHLTVTGLFEDSTFKVFQSVSAANGLIKAIFLPESLGQLARKDIDGLTNVVKPYAGKGVAWFKVKDGELSGGVSKFIDKDKLSELEALGEDTKNNGLWLFFADVKHSVAHACADAVRRHLGKKLELITDEYAFAMVVDFPLLEYDDEDERFYACHHPFTQPHPEDLDKFMNGNAQELQNLRADAYDLVCNGYELAGGSVRIYENPVQKRMFEVLGMSEEEVLHQFGFFVEALTYGVPPHAGIAFGFDRLVMLLAKTENIRDVIAFPKTATASDMMSSCPSDVSAAQLKELHMQWNT